MFTNTTIGLGPIAAFRNDTIGPTKKKKKVKKRVQHLKMPL